MAELLGEILRFLGKEHESRLRPFKSHEFAQFSMLLPILLKAVLAWEAAAARTRDTFNLTLSSCCLLIPAQKLASQSIYNKFFIFIIFVSQKRMCALTLAFRALQGAKLLSHRETGLH